MVILVALVIPINFAIYVMIIRKNKNLDMVPAMLYSGIFSLIYGAILSKSFEFTSHDLLMGFLLGVPSTSTWIYMYYHWFKDNGFSHIYVGLLMLMETLCGPLWVWLFLNEIPPLSVFIGGAVIISAIILKSFDKKNKARLE